MTDTETPCILGRFHITLDKSFPSQTPHDPRCLSFTKVTGCCSLTLCNPSLFSAEQSSVCMNRPLGVCSPGCLSTHTHTMKNCPQAFEMKYRLEMNKDMNSAHKSNGWQYVEYCILIITWYFHIEFLSTFIIPGMIKWPLFIPVPLYLQVLCGVHAGVKDTSLHSGAPAAHTLDALHNGGLQSVCGVWASCHEEQQCQLPRRWTEIRQVWSHEALLCVICPWQCQRSHT